MLLGKTLIPDTVKPTKTNQPKCILFLMDAIIMVISRSGDVWELLISMY